MHPPGRALRPPKRWLCSAGKGTDESKRFQLSLVPTEPENGVAIPRMR